MWTYFDEDVMALQMSARISSRPPQRTQDLTSTSNLLACRMGHGTVDEAAQRAPPAMRLRCFAELFFAPRLIVEHDPIAESGRE